MGQRIKSPFLNLATELWDRDQRRLTLLLDPGRTKQGVGPNLEVGAPLVPGKTVKLVVSPKMQSTSGAQLRQPYTHTYTIVRAERGALDPSSWTLDLPYAETRAPLRFSSDRPLDEAAARRLIRVEDADGNKISGSITASAFEWSFTPAGQWMNSEYVVVIEAAMEDVAGNTIGYAFDAPPGTRDQNQKSALRRFTPQTP